MYVYVCVWAHMCRGMHVDSGRSQFFPSTSSVPGITKLCGMHLSPLSHLAHLTISHSYLHPYLLPHPGMGTSVLRYSAQLEECEDLLAFTEFLQCLVVNLMNPKEGGIV